MSLATSCITEDIFWSHVCRNYLKIYCLVGLCPCVWIASSVPGRPLISRKVHWSLRRPPWFSRSTLGGSLAMSVPVVGQGTGKGESPLGRMCTLYRQRSGPEDGVPPSIFSGQLSFCGALWFCLLWLPCSSIWSQEVALTCQGA